jgi:PAS domain S-box-containing protein
MPPPDVTYLECLPALVFLTDPRGRVTFTNRRYQEYTGLSAGALVGEGLLTALHPADRRGALSFDPQAPAGMLYRAEQRIRRHDGAWRYHLTQAAALRDDSGGIAAWLGCSFEIHNYKRIAAEEEPDTGSIQVRMPRGLEALVPAYLDERRRELGDFSELLAAGDFATIAERSHKVKGSGRAFGFSDLTRIGAAIEAAARLADRAAVERRLKELAGYLDRVEVVPQP